MIYYNMIMKVKIPKTQSNNQTIESYWELNRYENNNNDNFRIN